jgi:PAS domain S-box-containing protein
MVMPKPNKQEEKEHGDDVGAQTNQGDFSPKQVMLRLASIVESSNDAIISESMDGKITSWNPAAEKIFGYTKEEALGKPMFLIGPKAKEAEFQDLLKRIKNGEIIQRFKTKRKRKDGTILSVSVSVSPIKDDTGKIIGLSAIDRDLSGEIESSQYARSLIEASVDPLVTISPDGKITDVNEATMNATGATREELIGTNFSDYFTEPEKAEDGYQTVLEKGSVSDYALTIKHKNGKLMDVLYNASTYKDVEGNVLGIFAAARDVTKTKQASEYTRSLIEASVDPLVTISPGGKITDVNEATMNATGATRKELIGTNFSDYFTEPQNADRGYQKVLAEGSVKDYPLTIRHKNGRLTDVSYNASIYKDTRGTVIGVFAAARDITEQKQASQYARSLIEASLDPLVTISTDGKITDVNKATVTVTGVPRRELIGSDFSLYFTSPGKAREGYQQAFKKGEVRDYLLTIRNRLGKETSVLYNASVYRDDKGKVLGVFAAAREIGRTELKAAKARELQRMSKEIVFRVALSHKMGKGSVKLSEKDGERIGLSMVDDVTIRPTRQEISGRRINAMSITSSRIQQGTIVMGIKDARELGLEEDDTVHILQAGVEEAEEVDEELTVPLTATAPTGPAVTISEEPVVEAPDEEPTKETKEAEETDAPVAEETEDDNKAGEQDTAVETNEENLKETRPPETEGAPEEESEGKESEGEGKESEEPDTNEDVPQEEKEDTGSPQKPKDSPKQKETQKPKEAKQTTTSKKAFEDKIDALRNSP